MISLLMESIPEYTTSEYAADDIRGLIINMFLIVNRGASSARLPEDFYLPRLEARSLFIIKMEWRWMEE